jgi:hypothetical protein
VHHNIVVNAEKVALNIWTSGDNDYKVKVRFNILAGQKLDIKVNTRTTNNNVTGERNVLVNNQTSGAYKSKTDLQISLPTIFKDPSSRDFRLKPTYNRYRNTYIP